MCYLIEKDVLLINKLVQTWFFLYIYKDEEQSKKHMHACSLCRNTYLSLY